MKKKKKIVRTTEERRFSGVDNVVRTFLRGGATSIFLDATLDFDIVKWEDAKEEDVLFFTPHVSQASFYQSCKWPPRHCNAALTPF